MPTINELKLQRGQLGTQANALITAVGCTKDQRAQATKLLDEADGITSQIVLMERAVTLEAENRQIPATPRPNPAGEPGNDEARDATHARKYRNSFEVYMRFGEKALTAEDRTVLGLGSRAVSKRAITLSGGEKRDITVGASGNYIVPQEFYNELISAKKFIGALQTNVHKKVTPGNGAPMKIGFENDTANTITVIGENTTVTETDPTLSGVIASTDTLATLIKVSRQELDDSAFDLPALFRDRIGKRYARGLENFIANGDGFNIASLVTSITQNYTTVANTGPVYDDFVNCEAQLDPEYEKGAKWFMTKSTRNWVWGLLDTLGRPIFPQNPQTGMVDHIINYPIELSAYLNNYTVKTVPSVVFGDLDEGYLLRTDGEMTIQRLDERYADELMVGFLGYTRVGGNYLDAGTHPVVGMQTHA
jgi:HK97 family phage major capsid protein